MPSTQTLDYRTLSWYKPLFLDYLHRYDSMAPFFAADPYDETSWSDVATALDARQSARGDTATPLRALNTALDADPAALASLEALKGGAYAVVTGQQVGLLGGPLYTLYKAMTAVRLARAAEARLGKKVVPLFWMDTDDHDFAEVQATSILDQANELVELRYLNGGQQDADRISVGGIELSSGIEAVVERASTALPQTEFKADVLEALRDSYTPGRTMAEAFGRWLLRMTRGSGLAVVDPSLPELKALGAPVFEREIEGAPTSAIVAKTTAELVARGYHAQATPPEDHLNLFYSSPSRQPVTVADDAARRKTQERLKDAPERFSPNVLLRPVYQDTLFPTICYVAGPNELAYFAQLKNVYEHFEVTMPLIASRASVTVVERAQARFLDRYEVSVPKLKSNDESVLNEIVRAQTPPQLDEDLSRARNCIQDITAALERDLSSVDRSLVPTVKSTRGKLLHHLKELESKALRAVKRKNDTVRQQFLSTRTALFPSFDMQERRLSALGYLNKYGWHFGEMVEQAADPQSKAHLLLQP